MLPHWNVSKLEAIRVSSPSASGILASKTKIAHYLCYKEPLNIPTLDSIGFIFLFFLEPDTPFIDSDSDPEDGTDAAIEGIPRSNSGPAASETSGEEESPSGEDASEEAVLRERPRVEQSDPEDASPLHRLGLAEGCWEAEGDSAFRSGDDDEDSNRKVESLLVDLNTNQSNNSLFSHLLIN